MAQVTCISRYSGASFVSSDLLQGSYVETSRSLNCVGLALPQSQPGLGYTFGARVATSVLVSAAFALGGCAIGPTQKEKEAKALAVTTEPLAEYMSRAQAAETVEGGRERARLIYRNAAKAYPTDKRPWLRLAQSYFDTADYGNAVLAAQEVVQRDTSDKVAQGLLAVSGLRISTVALSTLRTQNDLNFSTRTEAEAMAANLRSVLGESVLVPKPVEAAPPPAKPQPRVRRPAAPRAAPATSPPAAAAPVSPFGSLK